MRPRRRCSGAGPCTHDGRAPPRASPRRCPPRSAPRRRRASPSTTRRTRWLNGGSPCARRRAISPSRNSSTACRAPELHRRAPRARGPARTPGPASPRRPARPAIWTMRAKARSSERKPACWRGASASTTAATVTSGRSCPFATICVPSRIAGAGPRELLEQARHRAARRTRSTPSMRTSRAAGTSRASAALDPLGPGALARRSPRRRSAGTRRAPRSSRPQWWQTRRARAVVVHQGDVAVGAARDPPALAAEGHEREAAPGGQHDRPSRPAAAASCSAARERPRDRARRPGGACRRSPPRGSGEPSARARQRERAAARARSRGAGWRCRRPRRRRRGARAQGRDLAGVVAGRAVLLVGRVVLLVHDDQAEARHRGEDGAARAEHHVGLALAHAPVLDGPLGRGERRVPDRDAGPEAGAQAPEQLGRQGDLGHQHDAPAAPRPRRLDRVEVDLGLARAGHPVQQVARRRPPSIAASIARSAACLVVGQPAARGRRAPPTERRRGAVALGRRARSAPSRPCARSVAIVVPARRTSSAAGSVPPAARERRGDLAPARRRRASGGAVGQPGGQDRARPGGRRGEHPRPVRPRGAGRRRRPAAARAAGRWPRGRGSSAPSSAARSSRSGRDRRRSTTPASGASRPSWVGALAAHHDPEHAARPERARHERAGHARPSDSSSGTA